MPLDRRTFLKAAGLFSAAGLCAPLCARTAAADVVLGSVHVREARYYQRLEGGRVRCGTCPHQCELEIGERGRCRAKENAGGRLYTLSYGNPATVAVDPVEKKPLLHFLPGSRAFSLAVAGCNFRCLNCQNWELSQSAPDEVRTMDLPPEKAAELAATYGCQSIAYTYSEPVSFYEYMVDTAAAARSRGVRNIWVSNAYIQQEPLKALLKVVDAAALNLKSMSDETYRTLNGGRLSPVLQALKTVVEQGVWLEVIHLVVPTYTDDLKQTATLAKWITDNLGPDVPLHLSRFIPRYKLLHLPPTPVSFLEDARDTAREQGLHHVYLGNVPGGGDVVFCPGCGAAAVKRNGYLLLENTLKDGKCGACGRRIAGTWS
ncbi:MAG: AmmeMemoRadiSam system radical SAM enzyme [Deltaproteobacteria bacterium]|nr:AmmeMemoRadiSam system radical SAM enzyme [Deltaproteobacteria bacterium]